MGNKVFISMPMRGRTKENIETSISKTKEIIISQLGQEVNFVNTIVKESPPYNTPNEAIWYLGSSIQILSQCDVLVIPTMVQDYPGCSIEREVAYRYGLRIIETDIGQTCPDLLSR